MIELYIDNQPVEITEKTTVSISASVAELTAPESVVRKESPMRLPMTPRNRGVMGFPEQALSTHLYNQSGHTGEIRCKGTVLLRGGIELVRCEVGGTQGGAYVIRLAVEPPQWIRDAKIRPLQDVELPFDAVLNEAWIVEGWHSDCPVKYLPVRRDREKETPIGNLSLADYHPFVQVKALLDAIVAPSGYRIVSEFLNEPFFLSLYMSGNFPDKELQEAVNMAFLAWRTGDTTATADADGRIAVLPPTSDHSFGAFVDQAEELSPEGEKTGDSAACFRLIDGRPAFVPTANTVAGFEYDIRYRTPVALSEGVLNAGVTAVVVEGNRHEQQLPDMKAIFGSLTDLKNTGGPAGNYYAVAYNGSPTAVYRLMITLPSGSTMNTSNTTGSPARFAIPREFRSVALLLYNGGAYNTVPAADWGLFSEADFPNALALGAETRLSVTTSSRTIRQGEAVLLDQIEFECAGPGLPVTLCRDSSVKPLLHTSPEPEERIALRNIFCHTEPQIRLIQAIGHLFHLHAYTDELTKTIYMEPRYSFLKRTEDIDWSEKIDPEKPIALEEPGGDRNRTEIFRYRTGDGILDRTTPTGAAAYGAWSAVIRNRFAGDKSKEFVNPLFTASSDIRKAVSTAPSASLIAAGDRDDPQAKKNGEEEYLNFPAKIVRYLGLKALPAGERWGWPSNGTSYPQAVFHSPQEDWYTLCFDDKGGQLGLKNYYQPRYDWFNGGNILTLYLHLTPSDVEAILHPNSTDRNFRGDFVFTLRGEKIRGRLAEIDGYDPAAGSTRCVFTLES